LHACAAITPRPNVEGHLLDLLAHPWVLGAAMKQSLDDGTPLLIESTSNQVDQFGGYTE